LPEEKVDGWRVLAYKDATGVRLVSRNGRDLTRGFPEIRRRGCPGSGTAPLTLTKWCLLADKNEAHLAEIYVNLPVAARVTLVGFA
jgi:hypothetical protein